MRRHPTALVTFALLLLVGSRSIGADEAADHSAAGAALLLDEKYSEAAAEFRLSIRADPRNKSAWRGLAESFRGIGLIDEAARAKAMADAAPAQRSGPAPALTPEQEAALNLIETAPSNVITTETYYDVTYTSPDEAHWKPGIVDGNRVWSAKGGSETATFDLTFYLPRRFRGDAPAFGAKVDTIVDGMLLERFDSNVIAGGVAKVSEAAGIGHIAKKEVVIQTGDVKSTLHVVAILADGRLNMVSIEHTEGFPEEGKRLAEAQAALNSMALEHRTVTEVASPVGRYAIDHEYLRRFHEEAQRRTLEAGTSAATVELAATRVMRPIQATHTRIELRADGTFEQVAYAPAANPEREDVKVVRTGTWVETPQGLRLVATALDGKALAMPLFRIAPYSGGAFLLDAKTGVRMVNVRGAVEADPIEPGPAPGPSPEASTPIEPIPDTPPTVSPLPAPPVPAPSPVPPLPLPPSPAPPALPSLPMPPIPAPPALPPPLELPMPPPLPPSPAAEPGPAWDTERLEAAGFKILRSTRDATKGEQSLLVEATRDQHESGSFTASFYDSDSVNIYESTASCQPSRVDKGERMRFTIPLPPSDVLGKVERVVVKRKA